MIYLIVWLLIASGAIYSLYLAFKLANQESQLSDNER